MTSTTSDISDYTNLDKVPGKFDTIPPYPPTVEVYVFPTLNIKGRVNDRVWTIYVALRDKEGEIVPIRPEYLTMSVDRFSKLNLEAIRGTYYGTETGKKILSKPTKTAAKNVGRKNETNPLTQAIKEAYAEWRKKKDTTLKTDFQLPQLVNNLDDYPLGEPETWAEKPVYLQLKYDGIRAVYYFKSFPPKSITDIASYSRNRKDFPEKFTNIRKDILSLYNAHPDLFSADFRFDGEYYIDGESLQNISGATRTSKVTDYDDKMQYIVYDCFRAPEPGSHHQEKYDVPYVDRYAELRRIFQGCRTDHVKCAPTWKVTTNEQIDEHYKKALDDGYEGIIIRKPSGPYEFSINQHRSRAVLRRKPTMTAEFEIVGWKTGKGKYTDLVVFECKTTGGKTFSVDPKWDDEKRKAITEKLGQVEANGQTYFDNHFKGKMATVEYQNLSDAGIPVRAKLVVVRDYE
ncbi:hypothetical protein KDA11_05695 [Candidatus Saccharibacteria bacterium]|nr:hypothetical protein [Candidatus Saccharibacteria bacterium]